MTDATEAPKAPGPEADDEPELLDTGQEEVFSRAEVERGVIEHAAMSGRHREAAPASAAERDEAQTERQAPDDAAPGEGAG